MYQFKRLDHVIESHKRSVLTVNPMDLLKKPYETK
jgi:hypothetical protein